MQRIVRIILALTLVLCLAGFATAADISVDSPSGAVGSLVTYTISVSNAPNEVKSFGLDISYNASALMYNSISFASSLVASFSYKDANTPSDGIVRIGGFTSQNTITQGTSGTLAQVSFTVLSTQDASVFLTNLKDDISTWSTTGGGTPSSNVVITPQITYLLNN